MKRCKLTILLIVFGGLALIIQPTCTSAAVWDFTATPDGISASGFSLQFDDDNNDFTVEFEDIVPGSFSGVTNYSFAKSYDSIMWMPGLTEANSGLTLIANDPTSHPDDWVFIQSSTGGGWVAGAGYTSWDYEASTSVPIPGALWLLGSGLISVVGFRTKFKK